MSTNMQKKHMQCDMRMMSYAQMSYQASTLAPRTTCPSMSPILSRADGRACCISMMSTWYQKILDVNTSMLELKSIKVLH